MRTLLRTVLLTATLCSLAVADPTTPQGEAMFGGNLEDNLKSAVQRTHQEPEPEPTNSGKTLEEQRLWILEVPERNRTGNSWVEQSPVVWPFQRAVEPGRPVSPISVW